MMMERYANIAARIDGPVLTITLVREKKRNAIDEQTMDELIAILNSFTSDGAIKMAVLRAKGKDFCAGADLDWMRNTQQMDVESLQQQNMKLQQVFQLWFNLPVFTISIVHGNVVGGGIGLVAASDYVAARNDTRFRFSEVTLGLIPATIAPFVLNRTKSRYIRNAMLTAQPFTHDEALTHGLIDTIIDENQEDVLLNYFKSMLNNTETLAVAKIKNLVNDLALNLIHEPIEQYTTRLLAQVRKSEAASRRIDAFFKSIEKHA